MPLRRDLAPGTRFRYSSDGGLFVVPPEALSFHDVMMKHGPPPPGCAWSCPSTNDLVKKVDVEEDPLEDEGPYTL